MKGASLLISVVVPCYNEAPNIEALHTTLSKVLRDTEYDHELIYVNDGSTDNTLSSLQAIADDDHTVRLISLSRNFGKELAVTAGIHQASGDAIIMLDADGQHPPELIPEFIQKWQQGSQVVVGVRATDQHEGLRKHYGSKLFYKLLTSLTNTKVIPGATDYRLIDKVIQQAFMRITERNRITRGLIDWLGFKQDYVYFKPNARLQGRASYSVPKLMHLALDSFVSLSLKPLYFSFYSGLVILPLAILLGLFSVVETLIGDPLDLNITGTAYLVILVLFLLGIVLVSQGITALYLSHIHTETQNRPMFIIDNANSRRITL